MPAMLALWWAAVQPAVAQPRLVLVVVVDQMPAYFLEQFGAQFDGGVKRLMEQGAVFDQAHQDHAFTVTATGHASISTGAFPAHHGIVGNEFWDRIVGESVEAVRDADEAMVGAERRSGRSPSRMLRTAIGDWLKQQDPESKVFGVSLKDRSAIFLAGLRPDGAYWYDERKGNFATSTYYESELPDWVLRFNGEGRVDRYFGTSWTRQLPDDRYGYVADDRRGTGIRRVFSEFPHPLGDPDGVPDADFYTAFRLSPFADLLTLDFARDLLLEEGLGTDAATDVLLIGLSAADFIGHRYGPWSDEVRDEFLRIDDYLGEFISFLDDRVGRQNLLLVLTSDHGVMPVVERMTTLGIDAARIHPRELRRLAQPVVDDLYSHGYISSSPRLRYNSGLVFDFGDTAVSDSERQLLERSVAGVLRSHSMVGQALTYSQLLGGQVGGSLQMDRFRRSFHPDRSADIVILPLENHLISADSIGTTHGTPYDYDTHVPLIFWGNGIVARKHSDAVRSVDIAPTIASWIGIKAPDAVDGSDLSAELRTSE